MSSLIVPGDPTNGWLILIGGGEFSFGETEEIDRFLLSKLPADNRTVAFLPTASGSQEYARHFGDYLRRLDPAVEVKNVAVYRGRDVRRGKNLQTLRQCGAIYIGGGVTNPLLDTIRGTPVEEELFAALADGRVVAAIGAGAAALGAVAHDMHRIGLIEGIGLLRHAAIETAFDPKNDARLRTIMAAPQVEFGIAVPAGTALAIAPDRTGQILGSGSVALVRKPRA